MRRLWAVGGAVLALSLLAAVWTAAPGPARAATQRLIGPLAAVGNSLVDEGRGGTPVTLRGVEVVATTAGPYNGGFVDAKALETLVDWGANFVRLAISADQYLQWCPNETYDPQYRSQLAQAVHALTSAGIYTVLEVASSDPGCLWSSGQRSGGAVPLPGEDTAAVLAVLASQFGSNPLVGFEPFNEPQGCAESTTGAGASQFVADESEAGEVCRNEAEAALAWNDPGTVTVGGVSLLGTTTLALARYQAPGMDSLYTTIERNLPAGAPVPLVFLDANQWASDRSTFDSMGAPLAEASNVVEVFHPYDCQDTSGPTSDDHASALCEDPAPETCATTSSHVQWFMTDPATGGRPSRPVVFDEFDFPAGEDQYYAKSHTILGNVPVVPYQHGEWVNNMIAGMQADGAAGWALYFFQNADVNNVVTPYSMVVPGIGPSTPVPWTPNDNAAPAVRAMSGATLSCQEPPFGFG